MIVRIEEIRGTDTVLVVDEVGKYLGKCFYADFAECVLEDEEPFNEDDEVYWYVESDMLNKFLNTK
jgi:hypothetical protein